MFLIGRSKGFLEGLQTEGLLSGGGGSIIGIDFEDIQSNLVNTDAEGTIESVHTKRIMLFKLNKKHLLYEQNTKGIKENISIVKLNTSNLHKTVIPRTKSTETLKRHSVIKPFSA